MYHLAYLTIGLALVVQIITHINDALPYNRRVVRKFHRDARTLWFRCSKVVYSERWRLRPLRRHVELVGRLGGAVRGTRRS